MKTRTFCLAAVLVWLVTVFRGYAQTLNFTTLAGSAPIGSVDGVLTTPNSEIIERR